MPVNDRFLAGTFAALFKQLDGILAFVSRHDASSSLSIDPRFILLRARICQRSAQTSTGGLVRPVLGSFTFA
jgi:hypothetical protein